MPKFNFHRYIKKKKNPKKSFGLAAFSKLVMSCQIFAIVCCFTSNKNIVFFKDFILCQDFVLKCKKQEISSPQFLVSLFSLQGFVKPNQQCVCFNLDWFIVLHIYWCIALPVRKWSLSGKQGLLRGGAGRAVALPLFCLSWFLGSRWHG